MRPAQPYSPCRRCRLRFRLRPLSWPWWIGAAFLVDAGAFAWGLPLAVNRPCRRSSHSSGRSARRWRAPSGSTVGRAFLAFAGSMATGRMVARPPLHGVPVECLRLRADIRAPLVMQSGVSRRHLGRDACGLPHLRGAGPSCRRRRGGTPFGPHRQESPWRCSSPTLAMARSDLRGAGSSLVPGVHLRIVQPAIPQDERWAADRSDDTMNRYVDLSRSGTRGMEGVTHLIWPESAFPFLLTERPSALAAIAELLPKASSSSPVRRAPSASPAVVSRRSFSTASTSSTTAAKSAPPTTRSTSSRSASTSRSARFSAPSGCGS